MILSMTGYGKAKAQIQGGCLTVEIRSLNAKGADISIKSSLLPKEKDLPVRKKIAERLIRGTIDVYLSWEADAASAAPKIDTAALKAGLEQLEALVPGADASARATLTAALMRLPELNQSRSSELISEQDWPIVEAAIDEALDQLVAYRETEGKALYKDVTSRVGNILKLYDEIEALEPERIETVKQRLTSALEELAAKPDASRFEQELIFYLEKYDINEEKVRLRQHCRYFMETIDGEAYPGKKLGFIIQEMGREINTTGSKANHAGIQQRVVRMKDELEKIREQSLNIL